MPAIERGLAKAKRSAGDVEIICEAIVAMGETDEEIVAAMNGVKGLLSFYGSTPSYRPVLDVEDWGELQTDLNTLSKQGEWQQMSGLIDDTMVRTIAVVGTPGECAREIVARFGAISQPRVLLLPRLPGSRRADRRARVRDSTDKGGGTMTYGFDTTTDEVIDRVDLTGKLAVVTGASAGIGVETARALAAAGAHVVLAARNAERTEAAARSIRERVPGAILEIGRLDLTSLDNVRAFAAWFLDAHDELQLLINNAGVMYTPFERTADGFEMQFGTNHVGHFLLSCLLVPALLAGAPSRVVNLSSGGHMASDIVWDDPNFDRREYDKFAAYGQSKTANILFSVELDRRLADRGVHAYAVHPGMISTELGRYMTRDDMAALQERAKRGPSGGMPPRKSTEQGAATTVWAAIDPDLDQQGGTYLADCHVTDQHAPWARDRDSAARLWALSEKLVGEEFSLS